MSPVQLFASSGFFAFEFGENFVSFIEVFHNFVSAVLPNFAVFVCLPAVSSFSYSDVYVFESYCGYSVNISFTFVVLCIVFFLIVSVQRHPDNVTWLEVYGFAVVQLGGSFLNDVAIFVGYKQFTVKFEVVRPISLVVRASAVGNSKSVSAHAKYHSRSQCYGKYFFHSLSSS